MSPEANAVDALYGVGHWLVAQERHRDALTVFRTMLVLDGADARAWLGLGACHEALGENDKALGLYLLASTACGARAARCTTARARLLWRSGEADEAREAYEVARRQAETSQDAELLEALEAEVVS